MADVETLAVDAVRPHNEALRKVLAEFPGLSFTESKGWMLRTFTITGTPADIAAFRPSLEDWQREQASREAW